MTKDRRGLLRELVASVVGDRTYDQHQLDAVLVTWLCCKRTVYATNPAVGCLVCR